MLDAHGGLRRPDAHHRAAGARRAAGGGGGDDPRPGCPVCVTPLEQIDKAWAIAARPGVIITSFGDMLRVPGSASDLQQVRARGGDVRVVCEMLGLDPLYVANEGVMVVLVAPGQAEAALRALRSHALGAAAARLGQVVAAHPRRVALRTVLDGTRVVDLLPGDQLPRIW